MAERQQLSRVILSEAKNLDLAATFEILRSSFQFRKDFLRMTEKVEIATSPFC